METQPLRRSIKQKTDPWSPRGFSWGSCAILPRKWGEDADDSGNAPSPPPPFSAVTQPRCPRPAEQGVGKGQTPTFPPPRIHPDHPLPVQLRRAGSSEPPTFRFCLRSCPLRTRQGRGLSLGRTAPPHRHRHPHRHRKCLSAGTSLTSQGFDVKCRVLVRERWGRERRETRGRKSSSAPSCERRRHCRPGSVPAPWL